MVSDMGLAFWSTVILSVALGSAGAYFLARRSDTIAMILHARDRYRASVIGLTVAGTVIGGGMFLGIGQIGYEAGIVGVIIGLCYFVGLLLVGVFAEHLRQRLSDNKVNDLFELVGVLFSARLMQLFIAVNAVMFIMLLAAQFIATNQFVTFLAAQGGVNKYGLVTVVVVAYAIALEYSIRGGLRRDIWSDVTQSAIILICMGVIVGHELAAISPVDMMLRQPPTNLNGLGYGLVFLLGAVLSLTPSLLVRVDMWDRVGAARDARSAQNGLIIGAVISLLAFAFFTYVGMMARASGLSGGSFVTVEWIIQNVKSEIGLGIIVGGFLAAVLSSADTFLNVGTKGIYKLASHHGWVRDLKGLRVIGALVAISAVLLAFLVNDIVDLIVQSLSLLLVFLPLVVGVLGDRHRNDEAALFWSVIIGLGTFFVSALAGVGKSAFVPAVLASWLTYFILRKVLAAKQISK